MIVIPNSGSAGSIICPSTFTLPGPGGAAVVGSVSAGVALAAVQVISGKPGEEAGPAPATLVPDETRSKDKSTAILTWTFVPSEIYQGILLICYYGNSGGYVRFFLPKGTVRCVSKVTDKKGSLTFGSASCSG